MEKRIFKAGMFITAVVLFSSITQSHAGMYDMLEEILVGLVTESGVSVS